MKAVCFSILLVIYISLFIFSCTNQMHRSIPVNKNTVLSKKVEFSGYTWNVTHSAQPAAPGPNFWKEQNVWVDDKGLLHLKITKDITTGLWHCAELYTGKPLGLGTYELFIEGAIDKLDKNVVFGIFNYSGTDKHDEMDIEFAKWGDEQGSNLQYSVWPKKGTKGAKWSNDKKIILEGTHTTQRMIRSAEAVKFQSLHGFRDDNLYPMFEANCRRKKIISTESMPLYLNLWLFKGIAPSDSKEVEIIIHKFSFIPES